MSDEVLIQEIRAAMHREVEGLQVPPAVITRVLESTPRSRPPMGWLMPAIAVGIAALVAVLAVSSLTHRRPGPQGSSSVPAAARGLAARLAVLRRPQRARDILAPWAIRETESLTHSARVIGNMSRLAGAVHLGQYGRARVYLVVQKPPRFPLHLNHPEPPFLAPRLGDQATIAFVGPFREEAAINGPAVAAGGETVAATKQGLTANPGQFSDLWGAVASIVPDGVWRVKWVFQTGGGTPRLITVWPHLHANVAIGKLPARLQFFMRSAVWYGAHGEILSSFGTSSGPSLRIQHLKRAVETSLRQRVSPTLLQHFAVLRRPRPAGSPSLGQSDVMSLIEPNPLGLNIRRERFVQAGGAQLYVIPGSQGIALHLVAPGVGGAEAGTSAALFGGLFIETPQIAGRRTIVGLVADGNRRVRVLLRNGSSRVARVVDNVYAVTVPARAQWLILKSAAGRTLRLRVG